MIMITLPGIVQVMKETGPPQLCRAEMSHVSQKTPINNKEDGR